MARQVDCTETAPLNFGPIRDGSLGAPFDHAQDEYPTGEFPAVTASVEDMPTQTNMPPLPAESREQPHQAAANTPTTIPEASQFTLPPKQWVEFSHLGRLFGKYLDTSTGETDGVWELDPMTRNVVAVVVPPQATQAQSDHDFHFKMKNGKVKFGGEGSEERLKKWARAITEETDDEVLDRARQILFGRMGHGQQSIGASVPTPPALPPGQGTNDMATPPPAPGQWQAANPPGYDLRLQEWQGSGEVDEDGHGRRSSRETARKVGGAAWRHKRAIGLVGVYLTIFALSDGLYNKVQGGGQLIDFGAAIHFQDPFHYPVSDITNITNHF